MAGTLTTGPNISESQTPPLLSAVPALEQGEAVLLLCGANTFALLISKVNAVWSERLVQIDGMPHWQDPAPASLM